MCQEVGVGAKYTLSPPATKNVKRVMRNNFKLTMDYQDKLWAKVTLERLFKSGVGTPDIQNLAKKQSLKSY